MSGRIRSIKPEWKDDELLAGASDEARVLSVAIILMADDHGRGRASLAVIAGEAWRYQLERDDGANAPETLAKASRAIRELCEIRFMRVYTVDRQRYFEIRNWKKHQRVDHPGKPRVPPPPSEEGQALADDLDRPREPLAKPSRASRETLAPDQEHRSIGAEEGPSRNPPTSDAKHSRTDPPFGYVEALAAVNEARKASGLGSLMHLSRDEQTALMAYADHIAATTAEPAQHVKLAHSAWAKTADASGQFAKRKPMAAWLANPDAALLDEQSVVKTPRKPMYRQLKDCE